MFIYLLNIMKISSWSCQWNFFDIFDMARLFWTVKLIDQIYFSKLNHNPEDFDGFRLFENNRAAK